MFTRNDALLCSLGKDFNDRKRIGVEFSEIIFRCSTVLDECGKRKSDEIYEDSSDRIYHGTAHITTLKLETSGAERPSQPGGTGITASK